MLQKKSKNEKYLDSKRKLALAQGLKFVSRNLSSDPDIISSGSFGMIFLNYFLMDGEFKQQQFNDFLNFPAFFGMIL